MAEPVTGGSYAADPNGYGPSGQPDVADSSVGQLLGKVTTDLSTLMRKEVELAKVEIKEEATKAGKASGMLAGAGLVGYLVLVFLALALMFALDAAMAIGWAALITAVILAVVSAVLFALGRKQFQQVNPKPEQTVETLKEDVQWAKNRNS
ncbi:MAG TPA: phage holin family protein [Mycobacteriales bacterium]|nr:phage holin family protein [Mycobacteriales bacterium]